jgi:hypothetical protein
LYIICSEVSDGVDITGERHVDFVVIDGLETRLRLDLEVEIGVEVEVEVEVEVGVGVAVDADIVLSE